MQRARHALVVLAVIMACAASFASSGGTGAGASKPPATPKASAGASLPSLRLAMPDALLVVDPALAETDDSVVLAQLLYSGLVRLDARYNVVPSGATRYTISSDHKTYTFYLKRDLRFSNGDPVTAYDYAFAITRSLDPSLKSAPAPTYLLDIVGARDYLAGKAKTVSGIRVIDRYTLQLTARWPTPYFLMELTYPTSYALDKRAIRKLGPIDNTAWYSNPVGSGPYRLKSWTPNASMVLVPNKHFSGPRPALKQITISLAPLPATGLYQFVKRSLDVVGLPSDDPGLVHAAGVHDTNMLAIDGLYMNFRAKPFDNEKVRRALTLALDRTALVRAAMGNSVTPFAGNVPPGEAGYDPGLRPLGHSAKGARAAWKAAGSWPKDHKISTLYYIDDPAIARLAAAIVQSWHKTLGITVHTQPLPQNALLAKIQSESLPLYLGGWSADYPDPHDWLSLQWRTEAPNNNVNYSDPAFDRLVAAADASWNPAHRQTLSNQAQQILVDDAAWVPLYIPHRIVYVRPQVSDLHVTGYGLIPSRGMWSLVHIQTPQTHNRRLF